MFHFRFDLEDGVNETAFVQNLHEAHKSTVSIPQPAGEPFCEIVLDSLLETLPTKISYSFISGPAADGYAPDLKFARRDLFDARFQIIAEETIDNPESASEMPRSSRSFASALEFIDNPSDLVPLVYEGGLKTWECSLDLASYLKRDGHSANAKGQRVLELGCGTAIPTLCVLQEIFSLPPTGDSETHIHLQDYNTTVLHLITMPNILLTWYTSPAANIYRTSDANISETESAELELHITPELLLAFKTSLCDYRVRFRFFSGAWDAFDLECTGGPYNLVLTSETIYHPNSLPSLVHVMRDASSGGQHLCFVAGKTVYFGVGGGIAEFIRCVESITGEQGNKGQVEMVWEKATGVTRKVMRVGWT